MTDITHEALQGWYYLDADNNKKDPSSPHCERCKRTLKQAKPGDTFHSIVLHPEHPWFRLAKALEREDGLIGDDCLKRVLKEYGRQD